LKHNEIFRNLKFIGNLDNFNGCEFHDCEFINAKVNQLTYCKLFSTKLINIDFSSANVVGSETMNCLTDNCNWKGIIAILDCRFFGGLVTENDHWQMLGVAMIPESKDRKEIYKMIPDKHKSKVRSLLKEEFRL
jgi:hypothetical protein